MLCAAALVMLQTGSTAWTQQKDAPDDSFDALYRRGLQFTSSLKTLTARFTETTTSSLLTRPLVARGTLAVERPARVVLRYEDPEARVVLIDSDWLTLSWPGRNIRQSSNIASAQRRVNKYFVDKTPRELRNHFDIHCVKAADRPHTDYVTMLPRRKQIQEGITRLELWVDDISLMLGSMRITFPNGDTKLLVLTDAVVNPTLDAGVFAVTP
jgi:outer membrane lipoprotein-sorting protein